MALPPNERPIPELGGRSWAELEIVKDEDGNTLVPDQLRTREPEGWKAIPIRVRIPRLPLYMAARARARTIFLQRKLDEAKDASIFEGLEQACIAALAIRTYEAPYAQFADAEELYAKYDEAAIRDVLKRINIYKEQTDPVGNDPLSETQVFDYILAIRRFGHLGPLVDMPGDEQPRFLQRMADLAWSSPQVQSYAQSRATSTPEG